MPVVPILRFPDPRLRQRAEPVGSIDEPVRSLAEDLVATMRAAPGVGITGPHVGAMRRIVAIELDRAVPPRIYLNPRIVWASPETARFTEGSVSMPGVTEEVERPAAVRVAWLTFAGEEREEDAHGFMAACLQHEIDQLEGIFWLERLSRLKRERVVKRYDKLRRDAGLR